MPSTSNKNSREDTFPNNLINSSSNEDTTQIKLNHLGMTDGELFGFVTPKDQKSSDESLKLNENSS